MTGQINQDKGSMKKDKIYSNIDMKQTGQILQKRMGEKGYSVGEIQRMLMLSCPQPVYRWLKGQILPSVNHLYMLSQILGCHMEELLVDKRVGYVWETTEAERAFMGKGRGRMEAYMAGGAVEKGRMWQQRTINDKNGNGILSITEKQHCDISAV